MHALLLVLAMSLSTDFWQRVPVPAFGDLGPNWTQYQLQGQGSFFVVETGTLNFGVGTIPGTHETVALYFRQAQTGAQHADFTSSSPGYNSDGSAAPIFGFSGPVIRGQDKDNFYFGGTRWTFSYSMIQRTITTQWWLYYQQGVNAWYLEYNCSYPPASFSMLEQASLPESERPQVRERFRLRREQRGATVRLLHQVLDARKPHRQRRLGRHRQALRSQLQQDAVPEHPRPLRLRGEPAALQSRCRARRRWPSRSRSGSGSAASRRSSRPCPQAAAKWRRG